MAVLLPNGKQGFVDSDGAPLAGGFVYFYTPGGTDPKDTWQDAGETTLNTNPVILDARGEAVIYGAGEYRQVLKDSSDNLIWDQLTGQAVPGYFIGGTSTGFANAQVLASVSPDEFALTEGYAVVFLAGFSNSGPLTLNVAGTGVTNVYKAASAGPTPLVGGEIAAGTMAWAVFDGSQFELLNPLPAAAPSAIPSGAMMGYGGASAPSGWLLCDGSAVSRTTYAALFTAISTVYGAGDGGTTFNVPDFRSRAVIGAGTGSVAETVAAAAVSTGSDTFTVASNADKWITGQAVVMTTTGTLPTGLSLATTYYLIRLSATTIQFATTLANAVDGTQIDLSSQGTGNHTLTGTLTARALGQVGGQETHALTASELPPVAGQSASTRGAGGLATYAESPIGSSAAHNLMQPYGVATWIIKV